MLFQFIPSVYPVRHSAPRPTAAGFIGSRGRGSLHVLTVPTTPSRRGSGYMGCFIVIGVVAVILFLAYLGNNPKAPISVHFRPSLLDSSSQVLQVTNLSSTKTLTCRMEARNATHHENASYSFFLAPEQTQEIGILECGWWFVSNESVMIYVEGYRPLSTHVP